MVLFFISKIKLIYFVLIKGYTDCLVFSRQSDLNNNQTCWDASSYWLLQHNPYRILRPAWFPLLLMAPKRPNWVGTM